MQAAPVHVVWTEDACDARSAFERELVARAPEARLVDAADARVVRLRIARDGDVMRAEVVVEREGRASQPRRVSAASCDEAISALALVTALSIAPDPEAPPHPPPPERPLPAPARPPAPRSRAKLALTASTFLESLGAPRPVSGAAVGLEVARRSAGDTSIDAPGAGPSAKLSLLGSLPFSVRAPQGVASFLHTTLRLDGCPARFGARAWITPCAGVEGGALWASAKGPPDGRLVARPLFTLGAALRGGVRLTSRMSTEAGLDLGLVPWRDTFVFQPTHDVHLSTDVYRTPLALIRGTLGFSWGL